jgi:hypothetical protein
MKVGLEQQQISCTHFRFGRKFDAIKSEQLKVQQLETERDELREECNRLKISADSLAVVTKKLEEQVWQLKS